MVFNYVQQTIAGIINIDKPKDIGLDFSFISNSKMNEDEFYEMLEQLEEEMQLHLVDCAWRFENVKQLVDYINGKHK